MSDALTIAIACGAALVAGWFSGLAVALAARRKKYVKSVVGRCRWPWTATLLTAAALAAMPTDTTGNAWSGARHAVYILLIGAVTWLLIAIARTAEDIAAHRLRIDVADNRRIRKLRTQISIVRRIVVAVLVLVGAAVVLMSFDRMRTFGTSLLASAGIAGVVGGLAAQSALTSVFAGLQIAFTDKVRIDDVVVVEDEWGRIEEITLTYVVVHLWDERRLVLPTTYFTSTPFQNWTRTSARVLGSVQLYVDFGTPIDAMRAEAERVIKASPLWDGQVWNLQVVDTTEVAAVVRVLASASDAGRAFNLRCDIREQLLSWLAHRHPRAVPQMRIASPAPEEDKLTA